MSHGILKKITTGLPREFFLQVIDQFNAAYMAAHTDGARLDGRPLQPYSLGHNRHVKRQEALKIAAELAGVTFIDVRPRGYPQVIVECGKFRITEVRVNHWGDLPKHSKQNLDLVAANPVVGSSQGVFPLFGHTNSDEPMQAYVVILNPAHRDQDGLPERIGFGVPTANLNDWVFLSQVEDILAAYTDSGVAEMAQQDRAMPRLRIRNEDADTEGKK